MGRPWTVVVTDTITSKRMSFVFNSEFDMTNAASDFKLRHEGLKLEAMIPGEHKEVYIEPIIDKHKPKIPKHQMFSGF